MHLYHIKFLCPRFALLATVRENYDDFKKNLVSILSIFWLVLLTIDCPFVIVLFFVGFYLYTTNAFANIAIKRIWLRLWTGIEPELMPGLVDMRVLNESIYSSVLFRSIPQIIIQSMNNSAVEWSVIGYISVVGSSLNIVYGLYNILFQCSFGLPTLMHLI